MCQVRANRERERRHGYELFDVVDEEAVGSDGDVVGLEDGAELAGLFEVKENFALARCAEEDRVQFFEERSIGIV